MANIIPQPDVLSKWPPITLLQTLVLGTAPLWMGVPMVGYQMTMF